MPSSKTFLLLQGPHGPFFDRLGRHLHAAGAHIRRVAFNAGDEYFWTDPATLIRHPGTVAEWPDHLARILTEHAVTDIVLYGDVRPIHAIARQMAEDRGLRIHVFEEGYLRPYWITYERGGSNGHSPLMQITHERMQAALLGSGNDIKRPPARWGDLRHHKFYGAIYHAMVLGRNRHYPGWRSHRDITLGQEFRLNLRSFLMQPAYAALRLLAEARIRASGFPYILVLMQLEHDSSFQAHSPYRKSAEFIAETLAAFAEGAPPHHHLVFKAHPLEDGRAGAQQAIRHHAEQLKIAHRVHYVHGGKLARLLSSARAVVTVNSTSAQQALWRGLPVKATGTAIYSKPGITSTQTLAAFFHRPERPDPNAYQIYRDYLLETSQLPGGFYAKSSRANVLRLVVDMMLNPSGPYDSFDEGTSYYRPRPDDYD